VDGTNEFGRVRAGRTAEKGTFEVHAENRLGARGTGCGEPFEHRGIPVEGGAADRRQARRATARDERVDRVDDLVDRGGGEVDRARAVDLDVDVSGREERVAQIRRAI